MTGDKQRLDQWLWFARFFKSRTLAAKLLDKGHVRVSGKTIKKASATIAPNDIITFPHGNSIKVVRILSLATRRGPAPEAHALYEDLTPAPDHSTTSNNLTDINNAPVSVKRPTKKQRRDLFKFKAEND